LSCFHGLFNLVLFNFFIQLLPYSLNLTQLKIPINSRPFLNRWLFYFTFLLQRIETKRNVFKSILLFIVAKSRGALTLWAVENEKFTLFSSGIQGQSFGAIS